MITSKHLEKAIEEMKSVFKDVPFGIEHTNRVLSNANFIMSGEKVSFELQEIISLASVLHDIGAIEAQKKYGSMEGHYQEIEGPGIAKPILKRIGVPDETIDRICFIIGNHHTPEKIDRVDFQIVWEADYLENLQFGNEPKDPDSLRRKIVENFRTDTGKSLAFSRLVIND
jgi:HD superfamily phosphodiesterase